MSFYEYYGDNFKIECPTGSGHQMNLFEVAREIVERLAKLFLRDGKGRRTVYGGTEKFQSDPHWRDNICSTNISTATMVPESALAIRPAGPVWSACESICSGAWIRFVFSPKAGRVHSSAGSS